MNIPLLAGVYADTDPAVRIAYPVNMVPVPGQDGIADGYLRPAEGIQNFTTGQGADRGAIVWDGVHYRVSGTKLISISAAGVVTVIGDVGGSGPVRMDFSFDRLGIASNNKLWFWDDITLIDVTDPDVGTVLDVVWVDGYWMVTDGETLAVSDLASPTSFNPIKYGTTDRPDPVKCLLKVLNEVHVVSRNYIDVFQNVGGSGFPFARVSTAVITKGAIGTRAACVFADTVAFVGGGRVATGAEAPSVYQGHNAKSVRIATYEVDSILSGYTTAELEDILVENVLDRGSESLFVHLPDRTLVYDAPASIAAQRPIWHVRTSALQDFEQYRAQNITLVGDSWFVGDPASTAIGMWTRDSGQHYGSSVRWEFSTPMLYNEGVGVLIHELNLTALTGSAPFGVEPTVSTSYTVDGMAWSQDQTRLSGRTGNRARRLLWTKQGELHEFRIQRFRGDSQSRLAALKLSARTEPLLF